MADLCSIFPANSICTHATTYLSKTESISPSSNHQAIQFLEHVLPTTQTNQHSITSSLRSRLTNLKDQLVTFGKK